MFCYQCQETAGCTGCTRAGVCGKSARTAALQDLLVYVTRGLCQLTTALRNQGEAIIPEDDRLVTENLFVTITNANFDDDALQARIRATLERNAALRSRLDGAGLSAAARWDGSGDWDDKAQAVGVLSTADEDIRSLRELITYGLKGMAAYNHHVNAYGKSAPGVDAFLQAALAKTLDDSPHRGGADRPRPGDRQVRCGRDGRPGRGQHQRLRPPGGDPGEPGRAG